jgi:2-polyprenyl-6-methoxyphenol hydroxylase-like FAD-dependent oxidoreductase
VPAAAVTIDRTFVWDFGAAAASALSTGRVFVVGDAAHRATPNGGTGTSVAIADAHNLAWKLAYVVRGWVQESLLDSYRAERGPVAHRVAERSMAVAEIGPTQRLADDLCAVYRSAAVPQVEPGHDPAGDVTLAVLDGRPGARAPHL